MKSKKTNQKKSKSNDNSSELIRFDWAMKNLLRQKVNFKVLEGFLSVIFKEEMKIINIKESESNKQNPHQKFNRVDILVENSHRELLIIEIQGSEEVDYFLRMLFGVSKVTVEHIKKGDKYSTIPKVYHINIVYFTLGVGDDYVYRGTTEFRGLRTNNLLNLTEEQKEFFEPIRKNVNEVKDLFPEYYILCVDDFDNVAKDFLDQWIFYLKNGSIPEEFTAPGLSEVKEHLRYNDLSPQEKVDYDRHIRQKIYEKSAIETAIFKGELKGKAERTKLKTKNTKLKADIKAKEADIEAQKAQIKTIIKNLSASGMNPTQIAQCTNLTIEEVEKIINEG